MTGRQRALKCEQKAFRGMQRQAEPLNGLHNAPALREGPQQVSCAVPEAVGLGGASTEHQKATEGPQWALQGQPRA